MAIFHKGPFDKLTIAPASKRDLLRFWSALQDRLGDPTVLTTFAYRIDENICFAIKATGSKGTFDITVFCGRNNETLPDPQHISNPRVAAVECAVVDATDAFYFIETLSRALGFKQVRLDAQGQAGIPTHPDTKYLRLTPAQESSH